MPATTARSPSDPLDGYCMLTAVVDGSSEHRLSTAVQDDILSTTHDLSSDDFDRCDISACTRSKRADTQQLRIRAGERRRCSPPRTVMVPRGSQSSLMRRERPITAVSGYQLLMLVGLSTGSDASGRLRRGALTYSVTVTLVFQKRYFLDHLRLQIVPLACSPIHTV